MKHKTQYDRHGEHECFITTGTYPHAYQLRCKECDTFIQWLNFDQALMLIKDGDVVFDEKDLERTKTNEQNRGVAKKAGANV